MSPWRCLGSCATPRAGAATTHPPPAPHPGPDAPDVVVIVLDDLGFAQLGCYGSDIRTPNIDRLAAEGFEVRQAYDGPTAVEYAVMLALIIVVCIAAITTLGSNANNTFSSVAVTAAPTAS